VTLRRAGRRQTADRPDRSGTARELILEGAWVVTLDDAGTTGDASIAIQGNRILAIDSAAAVAREFPRAQRIDLSGRLLLPGLINAHLHPELHLLKGLLEELHLHDWADAKPFEAALALLSSSAGRWMQVAGIRAALADCALTGTTYVAGYGVTLGGDDATAAALGELGLRGQVTVRDAEFQPVPPDGRGRIFRLHAEEALTPAELQAAAIAHDRGERLVMHAAETEHRLKLVVERFGTTTVRLLDQYGLLSSRMLLSHAIFVDEEERELLARRQVPVISSPAAELKLSDGIAPIRDYVARGITVALGTDSAVCNNSNDMFLEMRQLGLTQKLRYGADSVPAEQILRLATRHGAQALGEAGRLGVLVPGAQADLIAVSTRNPRVQPLIHRADFSNVAANLVYAATGQDVTDVMVAGEWVVRERRLLTADADRLWEELTRAAAELYDRIY
jgi:5-methylthioadenosine/S-adenosylhomocysteine deaminase